MQIRSAPRVPRVRRRAQLCPCPAPRPPRGQRGRGLPPRRGRVPSRPRSALVPLRAAKEANARERRAPSPVCVAGLPGAPLRDGAAPTPLTRPRPDARPSPGGARRLQQGTAGVHGASSSHAGIPPTHKATGGALVQPGAPSPWAAAPLPVRSSPRSGTLWGLWPRASPGVGERCARGPPVPPPRGSDPPTPAGPAPLAVLEPVPMQDGRRGQEPPAAGLPIAVAPCVDRGSLGAPPAVQDPRPLVPSPPRAPLSLSHCPSAAAPRALGGAAGPGSCAQPPPQRFHAGRPRKAPRCRTGPVWATSTY